MMLPQRASGGLSGCCRAHPSQTAKQGLPAVPVRGSPPAPCLPVSLCLWPAPPGRKKKRGFLHSREHADWAGGGAGAVRAPVRWKESSAVTWASSLPVSTEGRGVRVGKAAAGSPRQHSLSASHTGHGSRPGQACTKHCFCSLTNSNGPRTYLGFPGLTFCSFCTEAQT